MDEKKRDKGNIIPFPGAKDPMPEPRGPMAYDEQIATFKARSRAVRRAMLAIPSWITPNGVTVFRTLLIVPIAWLVRAGAYGPALAVIVAAMLLDFVDGALAEARDQKTALGAFLDPLSDKVLVCGTLLALLDRLPPVFGPAIVLACAIAVLLTMVRIVKMARASHGAQGAAVAAKPAGKVKLIAETATMILLVGGLAAGVPAIVWTGGAFFLIALWYALLSLKSQLVG
jgi:phosphatidylglycerophosphate synthase